MRSSRATVAAALVVTTGILIAGCAGASSNPSPFIARGTTPIQSLQTLGSEVLFSDGRVPGRMYAAGPDLNAVDAYPEFANNPSPIEEIVTGLYAPTGMAVDGAGNVYVCNNAGSSPNGRAGKGKGIWRVNVYKRGQTTPFRYYVDGVWNPVDIAIASDGTVYIANYSGAVTVYQPNAMHVSRTLVGPPGQAPLGIAFDAAGNTFVSYVLPSGGGSIYEYAPGQNTGSDVGISFSGSPHGLAVDSDGNLVVAVSNAPNPGSAILVFAPGGKQPKMTLTGPFQPFMLAFSRNGRRLFVADYGSGNKDGGVFVYSYPGGTLLFKDTQGTAADAYGVAVDPRATP